MPGNRPILNALFPQLLNEFYISKLQYLLCFKIICNNKVEFLDIELAPYFRYSLRIKFRKI